MDLSFPDFWKNNEVAVFFPRQARAGTTSSIPIPPSQSEYGYDMNLNDSFFKQYSYPTLSFWVQRSFCKDDFSWVLFEIGQGHLLP